MQMTLSRRLAEAVGSWLHLEFCCFRAGLFSETALKSAVGQVLSSFPIKQQGARVHSDFPHIALNPIKKQGRKKEVDFALVLTGSNLPKNNAEIIVEAKWAASGHCKPDTVFTDFLRLAALKRQDKDAICLFLLAGPIEDMQKVTNSAPFIIEGKRNYGIGFSNNPKTVKPDKSNIAHRTAWGTSISDLLSAGLEIPASFVVRSCDAYPASLVESFKKLQSQNKPKLEKDKTHTKENESLIARPIEKSTNNLPENPKIHESIKFQARCWEIVSVSDGLLQWN